MRQAVIVIGSNYGDEGKGLAAYTASKRLGTPCLNILINGGPQRGHTVETREGGRHVFHHFGSGSVAGAVSYLDEDFMVNPMVFEQERVQLQADFPEAELRCLVNAACRVTMPYDMVVNQILEDARGHERHGSCGMGVYETRLRYETTNWALRWREMTLLTEKEFFSYCRRIADEYIPARLAGEGLVCPEDWADILRSEDLAAHVWADLQAMTAHTEMRSGWPEAAEGFDHLVFEASQGLALDEDNIADSPHLTPSHTTSLISARRILALDEPFDTEVQYITRAYLTRHGAGPLPTECPMTDISPEIIDRTNMPNPYQQTIRYGRFDGEAVRKRIFADLTQTRRILPQAKATAVVTHLNETGGRLFGEMQLDAFVRDFDQVMLSDHPYGFC